MRIFTRLSLLIVVIGSLAFTAAAQLIVPDTKLMGLKGKVKSLVTSTDAISGYAESVLKDKTKNETTYQFDENGYLTGSTYEGAIRTKSVYSKIDGYKTLKIIHLEEPPNKAALFTIKGSPEPAEPDEQLTEPDVRFDVRYAYEITPGGTLMIERRYTNTGKVSMVRIFKYDKAGVLVSEREEDEVAVMTYSFKYDGKNNVVEVFETRDIKVAGSDSTERITYTEYKFDATGNWTHRKSTRYVEVAAIPQNKVPAEKFNLVDIEVRTFSYY